MSLIQKVRENEVLQFLQAICHLDHQQLSRVVIPENKDCINHGLFLKIQDLSLIRLISLDVYLIISAEYFLNCASELKLTWELYFRIELKSPHLINRRICMSRSSYLFKTKPASSTELAAAPMIYSLQDREILPT